MTDLFAKTSMNRTADDSLQLMERDAAEGIGAFLEKREPQHQER